jgi:uncharacterized protein (DUF58 family)
MRLNKSSMDTIQPKVTVRMNAPWLKVLIIMLGILDVFDPNKAWAVVLVGFGGLWLLAYVWASQLGQGLRLHRQQQYGWLQVGDWVEEQFTFANTSLAPATWVSIEDHSDLTEYSVSVGTGIGGSSDRRWKKRVPCKKRGKYHLGPLSLHTGDIFGIYSVEIQYPQTDSFIVHPPIIPLPYKIQNVSGRRMDANRASRINVQKSVSSYSVREYVPGDSLSKMHWKTTAKYDQPYVRIFENVFASNSWWILLDLDAGSQFGEGDQATDEHSIILASSLADLGLRNGKSVGLLAMGQEMIIHAVKQGMDQRGEILNALSLAQRGTQTINSLLAYSEGYLRPHSSALVITASIQEDWLEQLDHLRNNRIIPTVFLVSSDIPEHNTSLAQTGSLLTKWSIDHHLVIPELFTIPEAKPGKWGEISWKYTPTGKAIKISSGEETD